VSVLASLARPISELLLQRLTVTHDVRALAVADKNGLSLVSTLTSGTFDDSLAAFAGLAGSLSQFATDELHLGGFVHHHLMGRDRQLFVVYLTPSEFLIAMTDVTAVPTNVLNMLMGLAVHIMNLVAERQMTEVFQLAETMRER
jgi:predicted regulator of Ras-like GTPase activity (Roadblock/LC7/MglB family)